jgi:LmbE family N-acetylglucosaminyl deacetylase
MKKIKNLLIFAHPDDDILSMGGYISKKISSEIFKVMFIAEGTSCRYLKKKIKTLEVQKEIDRRNNMAKLALKSLGKIDLRFSNFPCGRLDSVDIIDINKVIEDEIKEFKPNNIFTHNVKDCNNDHQIINRAVMMATRPNDKNKFLKKIFSCEVLSSSEWNYGESFNPNYFEKLSYRDIKKKINALKFYKSEYQKEPSPRNGRGVKILANFRGLQCGEEFAEAFELKRSFNN